MFLATRKPAYVFSTLLSRKTSLLVRATIYSNRVTADEPRNLTSLQEEKSIPTIVSSYRDSSIATNVGEQRLPAKTSTQLKDEIDYIFGAQYISRTNIRSFVEFSLIDCNPMALAHLMRVTGKLTKSRRDMLLRNYMPIIASKIKHLSASPWSFASISYVMFGLQRMQEKDDGILEIISTMSQIINDTARTTQVPIAQNISMILLGLESNLCREIETKQLLELIVKMMKACSGNFDAQHISGSLFGLQSMRSDCREVRELISTLTVKIDECTEDFGPQNISASLYGLQRMSSDHPEVIALIVALETKVHTCQDAFSAKNISDSLFGLQCMSSDHPEVRRLLSALEPRTRSCRESLTSFGVGDAMIGLRGMSTSHPEVLSFVKSLTPFIRETFVRPSRSEIVAGAPDPEVPRVMDARCVQNVLSGLRRMDSDCVEVRGLLQVLSPWLVASTMRMNSHHIGEAITGFRGLSSSRSEVRAILITATRHIAQCTQVFGPETVGNCLLSLARMSSDAKEVRQFLAALAPHVLSCKKPLSASVMARALCAMQGLDSGHAEVATLLSAVAPKLALCEGQFDAVTMSNVLYSIQHMSSDCPEVLPLLSALLPKITGSSDPLNAEAVSRALFGMQGMSSKHSEVASILSVIASKLQDCSGELSADDIGRSLFGLQGGLSDDDSVKESEVRLVDWVHTKLSDLYQQTENFDTLPTESLFFLSCIITLRLPQMKIFLTNGNYESWVRFHGVISDKLEKRKESQDPYFSAEKFVTIASVRIADIAKGILKGSTVAVSTKDVLCGLFESDIVIRAPTKSKEGEAGADFLLNIEITDVYPKLEKKKNYRGLRDEYLRSQGVVVVRLEMASLKKMRNEALKKWVESVLADADLSPINAAPVV